MHKVSPQCHSLRNCPARLNPDLLLHWLALLYPSRRCVTESVSWLLVQSRFTVGNAAPASARGVHASYVLGLGAECEHIYPPE